MFEINPAVFAVGKECCEEDAYGQLCPVVIGAERVQDSDRVYFMGAGLEFMPEGIEVTFTDSLGEVKESQRI